MSTLIDKKDGTTPRAKIGVGAQHGALQDAFNWVGAAKHVRQQTNAVLLTAPKLFRFLENELEATNSLRALIETMPKNIDGLTRTTNYEFHETPIHDGQEQLQTPIRAARDRSEVTLTYDEVYGQALANFWTWYGDTLMMDPDLGRPGIISNQKYIDAGSPPITPDMQSFAVLYYEADETFTRITNAWIILNQMPTTGGEIIGGKEAQSSREVPEVSIPLTGYQLVGKNVDAIAINYIRTLQLSDLRPEEIRLPMDGISSDVAAAERNFKNKLSESVS